MQGSSSSRSHRRDVLPAVAERRCHCETGRLGDFGSRDASSTTSVQVRALRIGPHLRAVSQGAPEPSNGVAGCDHHDRNPVASWVSPPPAVEHLTALERVRRVRRRASDVDVIMRLPWEKCRGAGEPVDDGRGAGSRGEVCEFVDEAVRGHQSLVLLLGLVPKGRIEASGPRLCASPRIFFLLI